MNKIWDGIKYNLLKCHQDTHEVPQGLMVGLIVFIISINDLDAGTGCTLSKFADYMKLWGVADVPDSPAAIQRNLDRLENLA